jgi:hypothetical protein
MSLMPAFLPCLNFCRACRAACLALCSFSFPDASRRLLSISDQGAPSDGRARAEGPRHFYPKVLNPLYVVMV